MSKKLVLTFLVTILPVLIGFTGCGKLLPVGRSGAATPELAVVQEIEQQFGVAAAQTVKINQIKPFRKAVVVQYTFQGQAQSATVNQQSSGPLLDYQGYYLVENSVRGWFPRGGGSSGGTPSSEPLTISGGMFTDSQNPSLSYSVVYGQVYNSTQITKVEVAFADGLVVTEPVVNSSYLVIRDAGVEQVRVSGLNSQGKVIYEQNSQNPGLNKMKPLPRGSGGVIWGQGTAKASKVIRSPPAQSPASHK